MQTADQSAERGEITTSQAMLKDVFGQIRNGVPTLPSRGEAITVEKIQRIMDEEGM